MRERPQAIRRFTGPRRVAEFRSNHEAVQTARLVHGWRKPLWFRSRRAHSLRALLPTADTSGSALLRLPRLAFSRYHMVMTSFPFGLNTRRHSDNEWFPAASKIRS